MTFVTICNIVSCGPFGDEVELGGFAFALEQMTRPNRAGNPYLRNKSWVSGNSLGGTQGWVLKICRIFKYLIGA